MKIVISTIAVLAVSAAAYAPAAAQGLSSEEIKKRFNAHRGLQLAPVKTAPAASTPSKPAATAGAKPRVPASTVVAAPSSGGSTQTAARPSIPGQSDEIKAIAASYKPVPDDLSVNIEVRFEFDSAVLRDGERAKLDTVCDAMKGSDVEVFHIFGHTDAAGSAQYNLTLSQLRADEVRRYLINACGMSPERLKSIGVGEEHLIDRSSPRAPANRRVEFQAIG